MQKFTVEKDAEKIASINRTIRLKPDHFEKLMELSAKSDVSFNKVVNQCIEYALRNLKDE